MRMIRATLAVIAGTALGIKDAIKTCYNEACWIDRMASLNTHKEEAKYCDKE